MSDKLSYYFSRWFIGVLFVFVYQTNERSCLRLFSKIGGEPNILAEGWSRSKSLKFSWDWKSVW